MQNLLWQGLCSYPNFPEIKVWSHPVSHFWMHIGNMLHPKLLSTGNTIYLDWDR